MIFGTAANSLKRHILVLGLCVAWLNPSALLFGQCESCKLAFELSEDCIVELGLKEKVATYEQKLAEAQRRLGASYKIRLRAIGSLTFAPYSGDVGPVFTEVVRNADMRTESFITSVTAAFLTSQPEILFEHSALHEVAHIMNDDLEGYHRNGANIEVAEERVVLNLVGEARYEEYLRAYAEYANWPNSRYDEFLKEVKTVELAPMPSEIDEADKLAATTFKKIEDGKEHMLVYNGEIHDISTGAAMNSVKHDPEKLSRIIKAGKPIIFFHNHPPDGTRAMFPSFNDFGVAALFEYLVRRENPELNLEYRLMVADDKEATFISYGFQKPLVEEMKKFAASYRAAGTREERERIDLQTKILTQQVAEESFNTYLQHACPVDLTRKDAEVCNTNPRFFIWPSEKYFLSYRGVVDYSVSHPD